MFRRSTFHAALLPMILTLTSCQFIPGTDEKLIAEAENRIAQELIDPSSPQFRNVRVAPDDVAADMGFVCGEVNGKNRLGAFVGFKRFMYARKTGVAQIEYGPEAELLDDGDPRFGGALDENRRLFTFLWNDNCVEGGKPDLNLLE